MFEQWYSLIGIVLACSFISFILGGIALNRKLISEVEHLSSFREWYYKEGVRLKKVEAAYTANNKARQQALREICPECCGTGYEDYEPNGDPIVCGSCGGSGKLLPC